MSYKYDFLIYIGRFQPLHLGHKHILDQALDQAKRVIVLVGSANRPRSDSNPWTFEERKKMIHASYWDRQDIQDRLIVLPLDDYDYNDSAWLGQAQTLVHNALLEHGNNHTNVHLDGIDDMRVGVVGFEKDKSSYYLHMFPQFDKVLIKEQWGTVSATQVRDGYFQRAPYIPTHLLSSRVCSFLEQFMLTDTFRYVMNEFEGLKKHHAKWPANMPYPLQTVTVDSVVTQAGHILLVERNEVPGVGLLALPGGHVDASKGDSFDNAIVELMEEAAPMDPMGEARGKPMPKGKLRDYYTGYEQRFDQSGRDPRGYYLTTAFRFVFPGGKLWKVSSDIERNEGNEVTKATWVPIGSLDPTKMFADHYYIIQQMLDKTGGRN